jgi:hypothetical protein
MGALTFLAGYVFSAALPIPKFSLIATLVAFALMSLMLSLFG